MCYLPNLNDLVNEIMLRSSRDIGGVPLKEPPSIRPTSVIYLCREVKDILPWFCKTMLTQFFVLLGKLFERITSKKYDVNYEVPQSYDLTIPPLTYSITYIQAGPCHGPSTTRELCTIYRVLLRPLDDRSVTYNPKFTRRWIDETSF